MSSVSIGDISEQFALASFKQTCFLSSDSFSGSVCMISDVNIGSIQSFQSLNHQTRHIGQVGDFFNCAIDWVSNALLYLPWNHYAHLLLSRILYIIRDILHLR